MNSQFEDIPINDELKIDEGWENKTREEIYFGNLLKDDFVDLKTIPFKHKIIIEHSNADSNENITKYIIEEGTLPEKSSLEKNQRYLKEGTNVIIRWAMYLDNGFFVDCSSLEGELYITGQASPTNQITLLAFLRCLFEFKVNELSWIEVPQELNSTYPGLASTLPCDFDIWICVHVIEIYDTFYRLSKPYKSSQDLLNDAQKVLRDGEAYYHKEEYKKALSEFNLCENKLTATKLELVGEEISQKIDMQRILCSRIMDCLEKTHAYDKLYTAAMKYNEIFPNEPETLYFISLSFKHKLNINDAIEWARAACILDKSNLKSLQLLKRLNSVKRKQLNESEFYKKMFSA